MQRLVTIYLDTMSYLDGQWLKMTFADKHGIVEEHLKDDLEQGWRIVSVTGVGGASDACARGWIAVVLEK